MEKQIRVNNSQLSTAISFIKQHLDHEGIAGEEVRDALKPSRKFVRIELIERVEGLELDTRMAVQPRK